MLFIRSIQAEKPCWQVLGIAEEPLLAERCAEPWTIWVVGSAPDSVLDEIERLLRAGESPESLLARLREAYEGHFAVFVLNERDDHLVMAVDPYAIIKLYVASTLGGLLVGTQLSELLAHLDHFEILPQALSYFVVTGYTPARHTLFRGVEKVPPGAIFSFENGKRSESEYIHLLTPQPPLPADDYLLWFEQHWAGLLRSWMDRFQHHFVAVSGGVDSTIMLACLLKSGMPKDQATLLTIAYQASEPCLDNACDVEYSTQVARHYGIPHEVVPYDLQDDRLIDDFSRAVRLLGGEASFGLAFQKIFNLGANPNACVYCGQNADSVLSFGSMGHPFFTARPPFVKGLGGWCQRFYLFGGLHRPGFRPERLLITHLLNRYFKNQHGVRLRDLRPESFLLGIALEPSNWPYFAAHPSFATLADPESLASWFWDAYLRPVSPEFFAANPHSVFVWLYLQTYMQGAANRATAWGALANSSHGFLPFTNLGLLRQTARLRPDGRFSWHGKFPNVFAGRRDRTFPHFVFTRKDGADSTPVILSSIFRNRQLNAYVRSLLDDFDPERLTGAVHSRYLAARFWQEQMAHYEARNYAQMELKVFPRIIWLLALEEQARRMRTSTLATRRVQSVGG